MQRHYIYTLVALLFCGCNLFEATTPSAARDAESAEDAANDMGADAQVDVPDMADGRDVPCVPDSDLEICGALMLDCSSHEVVDNCGTTRNVTCGACATDESCIAGVCICAPEDRLQFCDRVVATCGPVTALDNCGQSRTEDCGTCTAPAECGGGGTPNVCACSTETDIEFCAANDATCGVVVMEDSCGAERTVVCGACSDPETCGGGGTPSQCGCAAESDEVFCPRLGAECGAVTAADNCGASRTTNCGGCPADEMCSANVCVCAPESEQQFCARVLGCGPISDFDNCGTLRSVNCPAICEAGEQCVGDRCTCAPDDAADFCTMHARECGSHTALDNCAMSRTEDCGACAGSFVCDAGTCVPSFPPADLKTWLRSDEGITLSMQGEVTNWVDRINGDDWIAPSNAARPTFIVTAQAGQPALRFFGGQQLVAPARVSSTEFTAVVVVQRADTDREGPILGSSASIAGTNEVTFGTTDTTIRIASTTAGVSFSATILPTSNVTVLTLRAGSGAFDIFQGDTKSASGPITASGPFTFDLLGAFHTLRSLRGDVYEVMIWPRALSDAERSVVTSTLETRYGL